MNFLNNNILGLLALLLILTSILGPMYVIKRAEQMNRSPQVTGNAAASLSFTIFNYNTDVGLSARLADDNQSIYIEWNNVGQTSTDVYITDNRSEGFNLSDAHVTGIVGFNWTDPNASSASERYYMLGIQRTGYSYSTKVVGKYNITLTTDNGRWNYISLPVVPDNQSRDEVLRSIKGSYDFIWSYDPTTGAFSSWYDPFSLGTITNITPDKCYIIQATDDVSLTIVGTENTDINETIYTNFGAWNYIGWVNEIVARDTAVATILGDYDFIWEYIASLGTFSSWYDPFRLGNIEYLRPGRCYIIQPNVNNSVLTYST